MTSIRSSTFQPWTAVLVVLLALATLLLGAERAAAQSLSLTGGMTLLLGPPDAPPPPILGTPQAGQAQATPPPQQPPQTVYIVETQAPPGYGQPTYGQPGYGQPGAMAPGTMATSGQGARQAQAESNGLVPRLLIEPLMGSLVGWSGGVIGLLIGASAGSCFDTTTFESWSMGSCITGMIVGMYIGLLVGIPAGVAWAGSWFGGMGTFVSAFLGTLAGTAISILVASLVQDTSVGAGLFFVPLVGAMVGYELSSSANARSSATSLAFAPTFERGALTGGTAGVRFAF